MALVLADSNEYDALLYKSQQQWTKAEDLFVQVIQARKRVQGMDHQDTLSSIANLASTYIDQDHSDGRRQQFSTSLPDRIRDNIQIPEGDVVQVARFFGKGLMTLLLDLKKDNVLVTKQVVKAAAGNRTSGQEVMALLLDRRGDEVQITQEVVEAAAENWESGGQEVMALFLDRRGDEVQITKDAVIATARNRQEMIRHERMAQLLDRRRGVQIPQEVVIAAARNWKSYQEVMALLLDRRGGEVQITEEVVEEQLGTGGVARR
jgi:hypothetical protein